MRNVAIWSKEFLGDVSKMGEAGLRFAEQFEMERVLAAFECELVKVAEETEKAAERVEGSRQG